MAIIMYCPSLFFFEIILQTEIGLSQPAERAGILPIYVHFIIRCYFLPPPVSIFSSKPLIMIYKSLVHLFIGRIEHAINFSLLYSHVQININCYFLIYFVFIFFLFRIIFKKGLIFPYLDSK